jgi:hypothetical protein
MTRANKDAKLYDALLDLKRHLRTCQDCRTSIKMSDPYMMCNAGILLTLKAAAGYDDVIRLRIKAHTRPGGHVFACPDLIKHGKAYSLTAPALHVTAVQDGMF